MMKRMNGMNNPTNNGVLKRVFGVLVVLLVAATLLVGAGSAADVHVEPAELQTDEDGNILLIPGNNYGYPANPSWPNYYTTYVTWIKNSEGNWDLSIEHAGNYKLTQDFTAHRVTLSNNSAIKLDGNGKVITGVSNKTPDGATPQQAILCINAKDSVIENLTINDSQRSQSDYVPVVSVSAENVTIRNSTLYVGHSNNHNSAGIDVQTSGITIDNNLIILGTSGQNVTTAASKQRNESIAIKLNAGAVNPIITNNTVNANANPGNTPQVGILFNDIPATSTTTIKDNTFNLGNIGAILETRKAAQSLALEFINNIMTAGSWIYTAQDESGATAYSLTISGTAYNNNFAGINLDKFFTTAGSNTLTNSATWNTTPVLLSDIDEPIIDGQAYIAGNWWGTWSEAKKSALGYQSLTAKDDNLPVNDLNPLVKTDDTAAKTINIDGDTTIDISKNEAKIELIATLGDDSVPTFEWEYPTSTFFTFTVTNNKLTCTPTTETGTVTVTVKYPVNGVSKSIDITSYKNATPTFAQTADVDANGNVTLSTNSMEREDGGALSAGTSFTKDTAVVIQDTNSGVNITLTYEKGATVSSSNAITGNVSSMEVSYPETTAVAEDTAEGVTYSLTLTLDADKALNGSIILPTISPAFNETVAKKIDATIYKAFSMITATANVDQINANLTTGGITLTFTISKNDITDKTKIRILHIDGTNPPTEATIFSREEDSTGKFWIVKVRGDSFSSYVLTEYVYVAPKDTTPSSSSSSSGSSVWLTETPTQTPTPTPTETATPTDTVPTDIPVTQPTSEPSSPGFGILAALAGLGAVAVLRRK